MLSNPQVGDRVAVTERQRPRLSGQRFTQTEGGSGVWKYARGNQGTIVGFDDNAGNPQSWLVRVLPDEPNTGTHIFGFGELTPVDEVDPLMLRGGQQVRLMLPSDVTALLADVKRYLDKAHPRRGSDSQLKSADWLDLRQRLDDCLALYN